MEKKFAKPQNDSWKNVGVAHKVYTQLKMTEFATTEIRNHGKPNTMSPRFYSKRLETKIMCFSYGGEIIRFIQKVPAENNVSIHRVLIHSEQHQTFLWISKALRWWWSLICGKYKNLHKILKIQQILPKLRGDFFMLFPIIKYPKNAVLVIMRRDQSVIFCAKSKNWLLLLKIFIGLK